MASRISFPSRGGIERMRRGVTAAGCPVAGRCTTGESVSCRGNGREAGHRVGAGQPWSIAPLAVPLTGDQGVSRSFADWLRRWSNGVLLLSNMHGYWLVW